MKFKLGNRIINIHYLAIVGSTLHGINTENSDTDIKGVFDWDLKELLKMKKPQESIDKNNTLKEDWIDFIKQISKAFNLKEEDIDDLVLFESKKFFENIIKNELNFLDLIHSNKMLLIENKFKEIKDKKYLFYDIERAKHKFLGMHKKYLKEYSKTKDLSKKYKNLGRSLHVLWLIEDFMIYKKYSPRLNDSKIEVIKSIRNGYFNENEVFKMYEKSIQKIEKRFKYIKLRNKLFKFYKQNFDKTEFFDNKLYNLIVEGVA